MQARWYRMSALNFVKVRSLVSQDLWVQDVQRLQEHFLEQTRNRVERSPLWTRAVSLEKLQSTAHRMLLNMVSVICQRTEEDMVLSFRNLLTKTQHWQQWKSSQMESSSIRQKKKKSAKDMLKSWQLRHQAVISW